MWRQYAAAQRPQQDDLLVTLPSEVLKDRGAYAQVLWGIKPRIVAGLRGGIARGEQSGVVFGLRRGPTRLSPNPTRYSPEFSQILVGYKFYYWEGNGDDTSP